MDGKCLFFWYLKTKQKDNDKTKQKPTTKQASPYWKGAYYFDHIIFLILLNVRTDFRQFFLLFSKIKLGGKFYEGFFFGSFFGS